MNRKPPDEDNYKCLKTSLKSILKIDKENKHWKFESDINDLVIKCNEIVTQTYQYSAHNIRMLGESWINSKVRPKEFCRLDPNTCPLPFL